MLETTAANLAKFAAYPCENCGWIRGQGAAADEPPAPNQPSAPSPQDLGPDSNDAQPRIVVPAENPLAVRLPYEDARSHSGSVEISSV